MKNIAIILFGILFMATTATAQTITAKAEKGKPIMTFDKKMVDMGTVKKGEKRETFFEFTNTGDVPLEIDLISACDCTTTDYPRRAIAPGEKGRIDVIFDSTEKEASEVIDIDIFLKQFDEEKGMPFMEMVQYKFELVK